MSPEQKAALQLVDEGRLSLDDKLDHFLPAFPNGQNISVRQHTTFPEVPTMPVPYATGYQYDPDPGPSKNPPSSTRHSCGRQGPWCRTWTI